MDPEQLERLFILYLKAHKINYEVKDRVFTVKFNKKDAELYGDKLIGTFDTGVSQRKKVVLLGNGHFVFDSIVSKSLASPLFANLTIPTDDDALIEVNERLHDVQNEGTQYYINELILTGLYGVFEVSLDSAAENRRIVRSLLVTDKFQTSAEKLENNEFKSKRGEFEVDYNPFMKKLSEVLKKDLAEAEKEHDKKVAELVEIANAHAEAQYWEIQKEENIMRSKIDSTKDDAIRAATFDQKDKLNTKAKRLAQKLQKLIDKNEKRREPIKKSHDAEVAAIKKRKFGVEAKVLCLAQLEFQTFNVHFSDESDYYYIPAMKKFVKTK
ncbi:MAG: hypothetical protein ACE5DM_03985 [Candidatus Nanoarchaeia archaeon]